jgi:hypothetical protein
VTTNELMDFLIFHLVLIHHQFPLLVVIFEGYYGARSICSVISPGNLKLNRLFLNVTLNALPSYVHLIEYLCIK